MTASQLMTADRRYELIDGEVIDREGNSGHGAFIGYANKSVSPKRVGQFCAMPYDGDRPEPVVYFSSLCSAFEYVAMRNQIRAY